MKVSSVFTSKLSQNQNCSDKNKPLNLSLDCRDSYKRMHFGSVNQGKVSNFIDDIFGSGTAKKIEQKLDNSKFVKTLDAYQDKVDKKVAEQGNNPQEEDWFTRQVNNWYDHS